MRNWITQKLVLRFKYIFVNKYNNVTTDVLVPRISHRPKLSFIVTG